MYEWSLTIFKIATKDELAAEFLISSDLKVIPSFYFQRKYPSTLSSLCFLVDFSGLEN
jgi:hypothetical protein